MLYRPQWRENRLFSRKKCHFWFKISNFKLNFGICQSLRGLAYMSVFSSLSSIRIYYLHTWIISWIRPLPPGRSFGVCKFIIIGFEYLIITPLVKNMEFRSMPLKATSNLIHRSSITLETMQVFLMVKILLRLQS